VIIIRREERRVFTKKKIQKKNPTCFKNLPKLVSANEEAQLL
jgi:hypothetical protein